MFKNSVAVVLAAVLVLSCAACDRSAPEIKSTGENTSTYAGVSVQILYVETTEEETVLHVQWQNDTSYSILYGEAFVLQKWEKGQWVDCPMKENTGFITIGYQLEPGQSLTKPYTLNWAFGKLAAGHYRFITACNVMLSGEDEDCKLSAEFDIGESMDNGADLQGEFTEPPKLIINDLGEAVTGTYTWSYDMGDGTWSHACADSMHPLQMEKHLQILSPGNPWVDLNFEVCPDDYTVRCWPGSAFGDTDAKSEAVMTWNNSIQLKMADYLYEVTATWNDNGTGYYGTATYVFYAAPAVLNDVVPIHGGMDLYIAGEILRLDNERLKIIQQILAALDYDESAIDNSQAEYRIVLASGDAFDINLEEGYVSSEEGLAKLSEKQLEDLSAIIDWALEITKAK